MLKVSGIAETPCCLTGKTGTDVLQVQFMDKQFSGAIHISELQKMIERRANAEREASRPKTVSK